MKELSIEEKAKRYDDALEKLEEALAPTEDGCKISGLTRHCIESIFPELKISEDERIRRSIIAILNNYVDDSNTFKSKMLTWLEKQQKSIINVPPREVILAIWNLGNEWKELTNCSSSTEHGTQLEYIQKHWQESETYLRAKQDEQKPINKVEPKFKVGKWYQCTKDFFGKGVTFDKNTAYYCAKEGCLQNEYGCHIAIVKDLYDNFKLWTIQDAKDGDVLVDKYNNIGIFQKCEGICWHSYIYLGCDGGLFGIGGSHEQDDTHPATKEQCDLLFKKIHEAGYEWDANKKEIKRVNL